MTITVFIADDHPVILDGLRLIIDGEYDMTIVGEAQDGRETVEKVSQLCPDIAIIDITMPDLNGVEATRQIRKRCPTARVIILSMHAFTSHVMQAVEAGASGYLLKGVGGKELIKAIRTVNAGGRYIGGKATTLVTKSLGDQTGSPGTDGLRNPLERLSPREQEVLQSVVVGKTSAEIGAAFGVSPKTIDTYRYRIMRKLNVDDLPSLVRLAIQCGLTPLD